MALFIESEVRARARQVISESMTGKSFTATAAALESEKVLIKSAAKFSEAQTYDIFLSHSFKDSELVLGVKGSLEDLGYSVYVDWIDDKNLDRSKVTSVTADVLRKRMQSSKSLLYVTTDNSEDSKWMPWECGYFDGFREKVAIVPVRKTSTSTYSGQEYLGLYPYCDKQRANGGGETLWINKDAKTYVSYDNWVKTKNSSIIWKTN